MLLNIILFWKINSFVWNDALVLSDKLQLLQDSLKSTEFLSVIKSLQVYILIPE